MRCLSIDGLSFIYGVTNKLILGSGLKNQAQLNNTTKRSSLWVAKNRPLVVAISLSPLSPLFIECSSTRFLSLALHFIFSCLIKSYQIEIYRISMTRQPVLRLPNKGPFCGKKATIAIITITMMTKIQLWYYFRVLSYLFRVKCRELSSSSGASYSHAYLWVFCGSRLL